MRLFIYTSNENWICDRLKYEFDGYNHFTTQDIRESDIVWILAPWSWTSISPRFLNEKKVIVTIHHIVPDKFTDEKVNDFIDRDKFVDAYHVPCEKTKNQIEHLTEKPIVVIPFWVNQNIWFNIDNRKSLREKYNIPENAYVVGSFQRDTEGHDLKSPKLEKGPDIFCDIIENIYSSNKKLHVLLAGWRRQYIINRLNMASIPYTYNELPVFNELNELYNCLDMYLVSSRFEGGPQSIVECAANKTPIISTDVGLASSILSESSIYNVGNHDRAIPDVNHAYQRVKKLFIPLGMTAFIKFMKKTLIE